MKRRIISFAIDPESADKFEKICQKKYSTKSRELQIFIYKTIEQENEKRN